LRKAVKPITPIWFLSCKEPRGGDTAFHKTHVFAPLGLHHNRATLLAGWLPRSLLLRDGTGVVPNKGLILALGIPERHDLPPISAQETAQNPLSLQRSKGKKSKRERNPNSSNLLRIYTYGTILVFGLVSAKSAAG
jgi:hypothetical protein